MTVCQLDCRPFFFCTDWIALFFVTFEWRLPFATVPAMLL